MERQSGEGSDVDPLGPEGQEPPLRRLLAVLQEGAWVILATVIAALLGVGAYLLLTPKVYTAEADLLITPVPRDDTTLSGLGLIRESADPTRDIQTAARLATTSDVAERAQKRLRVRRPASSLLGDIEAEPVADSNVVTLLAEASSPGAARDLANAFAVSAVVLRGERLKRSVRETIASLKKQAGRLPSSELAADIGRLEAIKAEGDPTIRVEALARAPQGPSRPQPLPALAAAVLAGLIVGLGGVLLYQSVRPRGPTEEPATGSSRTPRRARAPQGGESAQEADEEFDQLLEPTETRSPDSHPDMEGARLIALNMALSGSSRAETADYLRDTFGLEDRALLDDVYDRVQAP